MLSAQTAVNPTSLNLFIIEKMPVVVVNKVCIDLAGENEQTQMNHHSKLVEDGVVNQVLVVNIGL